MAVLNVSSKAVNFTTDPRTPLLWVLREQIGLTGTKVRLRHRNAAPALC